MAGVLKCVPGKKQAELKHSCDGDTMKVAISSSLHEYSSPGTVSLRNIPPLNVNYQVFEHSGEKSSYADVFRCFHVEK